MYSILLTWGRGAAGVRGDGEGELSKGTASARSRFTHSPSIPPTGGIWMGKTGYVSKVTLLDVIEILSPMHSR
jgi:hypothetical protein